MSVTIRGDFHVLNKWQKQLNKLPAKSMQVISESMAEETLNLIADGFRQERAPNGKLWTPKKRPDGRKTLSGPTSRLRNWFRKTVQPDRFIVSATVAYSVFHQHGTRKMVARHMVPPNGLPSRWARSLKQTAQEAISSILRKL